MIYLKALLSLVPLVMKIWDGFATLVPVLLNKWREYKIKRAMNGIDKAIENAKSKKDTSGLDDLGGA